MAFDFLLPLGDLVVAHTELLPAQALGKSVQMHTQKDGLPVFAHVDVAIFGGFESRNAFEKKPEKLDLDQVRIQLYSLMRGNWNSNIIDLGDVGPGETVEDTYFVVKEIVAGLLEEKIVPVVLGLTQDITYPTYRALDKIRYMVNLVSIDSRYDFGRQEELITSNSFMSMVFIVETINLFNYSNMRCYSCIYAQEEINLMDRLFFDAYRLGEIVYDLVFAGPFLLCSHIVSLDLRAIRASEMGLSP